MEGAEKRKREEEKEGGNGPCSKTRGQFMQHGDRKLLPLAQGQAGWTAGLNSRNRSLRVETL